MFGKNHLIALAGTASAVRIQREPLLSAGATVREVFQIPMYSDHPVDYAVPDFGIAHETRYTLNNIKNAETKLKHKLNFMNDPLPTDDHPVDYATADFGQDPEITASLNNMKSAEASLKHKFGVTAASVDVSAPKWNYLQLDSTLEREPLLSNSNTLEVQQKPAYSDYPIDYVVPDFGQDHEVMYTVNNIKNTETLLKHELQTNWGATDSTVATPRNYVVPDFGVDEDVINVGAAIGNAEKKLGQTMNSSFGQTESNVATPRDYFVPDFGMSPEILYTQANIKNSEKQFGKQLNVSWDQTDNAVNPRGYAVPDFGIDEDIKNSLSNLDLEQGIHGRWTLEGFPEPKAEKADAESKAPEPSLNVIAKDNQEQEVAAAEAEKEAQLIPTSENTSETTGAEVNPNPISASDLTEAVDAQEIKAAELDQSVNGKKKAKALKKGKKAKAQTKFTAEEKAERSQKNDDADDEDVILAGKLLEQAKERKAQHKKEKAEAAVAAVKAADNAVKAVKAEKKLAKEFEGDALVAKNVKLQNEIAGASDVAVTGGMMFVQIEAPKNSNAPINQSLVKPQNWDKVSHNWFAQLPKDSHAPTNQSLVKPQNWDKVAHTWY